MCIKKILFLIVTVSILVGCNFFKNEKTNTKTDKMIENKDKIKITLSIDTTKKKDIGLIANVVLHNQSKNPVKIVKRLAIGYQDSDAREIYLMMFCKNNDKNIAKRTILYNRNNATKGDFEWLKPGEEFKVTYNIDKWYVIPNKDFEIQAVYDPSESILIDEELLGNRYYSNKILITKENTH
ncbi:MAG: hypothetical protein L3J23_06260 [Flavobacteriaceae bacterium]|nr:hypothetical protein [Flavobacteriaceae bacterium]